MTGKEEFEPLDDLFRKTFQDLPEKPAASGWDVPSPRVWQQVQAGIKPAGPGWTLQTWALVAALGILLSGGLYFALGKKTITSIPAPVEKPVVVPAPAATTPVVTPTIATEKPATNTPTKIRPVTGTARHQPGSSATRRGQEERHTQQASPLPGSKPAAPNSTEREKADKAGQQ